MPLESQLGTQSSFLSLFDDLATLSQQPSSLEDWALPDSPPRASSGGVVGTGRAEGGAAEPGSASVKAGVLLGDAEAAANSAPSVPRTARITSFMRRELQEAWL